MQTLKARLHWAREISTLSQRGLARRADVASRIVSQIEAGDRDNPELKTLRALADALGVSVGWLATGEGERPTAETIRATVGMVRGEENAEPAAE